MNAWQIVGIVVLSLLAAPLVIPGAAIALVVKLAIGLTVMVMAIIAGLLGGIGYFFYWAYKKIKGIFVEEQFEQVDFEIVEEESAAA